MKFRYILLIFLPCLIRLSVSQNDKNVLENRTGSSRLPKTIKPYSYFIKLEPHFDKKIFTGETIINIKVSEETNQIILHVDDLTLNRTNIQLFDSDNNSNRNIKNIEIDVNNTLLIINVDENLKPTINYTLRFSEFTGKLREDLRGFVYNEYQDEDGTHKNYVSTNFEPTGARRVFPCFDEPDFKATFFINLIRPKNYSSLSNMPILTTTWLDSNRYLDVFGGTPFMSTYIVSLVVSEFICTTTKTKSKISICARKSEIEKGRADFALDLISKTFKKMEQFTGIDYILPKLDIVVLPNAPEGFEAMENWGLITFSENNLLYDNKTNSKYDLNRIAEYTTHELSHQWFGNLVTLKWWKYLWLNEGFGRYFEYIILGEVLPKWNKTEDMVVKILQFVQNDETFETRPLNYDVETPSEIEELFDAISYHKGACIIRMMESFLTKPVFIKGLNKYLNASSFSTAEPSDLYYHLQTAVNENGLIYNVSDIMKTWDLQSGYPLVTVTRNYKKRTTKLKQTDFITKDSNHVWHIPITYSTNLNLNFSHTIPDFWLTTPQDTYHFHEVRVSGKDWILLNKNSTGYYRVNYDRRNWNLLADYLMYGDFEKIPVTNRAQLVDDSITLAKMNKLSYFTTLKILNYLQRETNYVAFYPFFENFYSLWKSIQNTKSSEHFQNHVQIILKKVFEKVTKNKSSDDHYDNIELLKTNVINVLCTMKSSECRLYCHRLFNNWKYDNTINLKETGIEGEILCGAVMYDTDKNRTWNYLHEKFKETNDTNQKETYLTALGCSENSMMINQFLDSKLNNTDHFTYFLYKLTEMSRIGVQIVLDYFKNKSEQIDETNPKLFEFITDSSFCEYFNTEEKLQEMKQLKFFEKYSSASFDSCIELIEKNIESSKEHLRSIATYYNSKVGRRKEWN